MKRKTLFMILLLAFAAILASNAAYAADTFWDSLMGPFEGFPAAYARAGYFIDGIIAFIIFYGLISFTLGNVMGKGGGKKPTMLFVGLSLVLSIGLALYEHQTGFSLANFGFVALIIIVAFIMFVIYKGLVATEAVHPTTAAAASYAAFFIVISTYGILGKIREQNSTLAGVMILLAFIIFFLLFLKLGGGLTKLITTGKLPEAGVGPSKKGGGPKGEGPGKPGGKPRTAKEKAEAEAEVEEAESILEDEEKIIMNEVVELRKTYKGVETLKEGWLALKQKAAGGAGLSEGEKAQMLELEKNMREALQADFGLIQNIWGKMKAVVERLNKILQKVESEDMMAKISIEANEKTNYNYMKNMEDPFRHAEQLLAEFFKGMEDGNATAEQLEAAERQIKFMYEDLDFLINTTHKLGAELKKLEAEIAASK